MDFVKAFTFGFEDPEWLRKIAISALIGLIPIVGGIYLLGWGLEVARRVATQGSTRLPDVDFGTYLAHGGRALVVSVVYTAPLWLLNVIAAILFTTVERVNGDVSNAVSMLGSVCLGAVVLLIVLALGLLLPPALTRTAISESIKAGLEFRRVWDLARAAPVQYLLIWLGVWVAGMLLALVGTAACGIGLFLTMTYHQAVTGHLYGQAYRLSQARV